ncbi:ABC transporter substrate-binding protein [Mesorhizobium sp. BAC0120]|uniref:ABC transporter substrate-binding protein n=1 Tax=Mesorhizobium sp. BAC0120 TaxID=3090670 RepID=UPI00298C9A15|nr:ABC transporter substrate-binding protein [Mesorhizobium sp. BAC0120]MDW6022453.1 ABC transporter substrate-binding protein [Mesorhizobium sp. BAC0120]
MKKIIWLGAALGALASTITVGAQTVPEIWHYYAAGSEKAGIDALIAYTNKQNPDAQVAGRVIPGNAVELRRQLQTAFMGGQPPAIYQSSMASELKTFVDGGRLHPLTDVWKEIRGDQIFPEGVQRVVKINGVPYGVPYDLSLINNVFYNKATFEKLGITPPADWDSLKAACKTLRDAGIQPLANAGGPFWSLYNFYAPLVSTVGVDGYYKIASGELAFDSPEFRKALALYRDTMVSCYAQNWSGKTWTQAADDVVNGNSGMFMMGIWAAAYMKQAGFEPGKGFDVFPAPGTDGKAIFQMDVFAAPEGPAETVKVAGKFIEAAVSPEGQAAFAVPKGSLAPNIEVDPKIYDYAGAKFAQQLAAASKANAVLPNLFFLLPTKVGTELGTQIEKFAIDPSEANESDLIATLEALRQEALAENAYTKW